MSVPSRVQIAGISDTNSTIVEPNAQALSAQNNCVWIATATKGYTITATGSGTGGAFTLASGALTPATASTGFVSTATLPACITSPSASSRLIVTIAPSQLETMASLTNYTGTLTLLVGPL